MNKPKTMKTTMIIGKKSRTGSRISRVLRIVSHSRREGDKASKTVVKKGPKSPIFAQQNTVEASLPASEDYGCESVSPMYLSSPVDITQYGYEEAAPDSALPDVERDFDTSDGRIPSTIPLMAASPSRGESPIDVINCGHGDTNKEIATYSYSDIDTSSERAIRPERRRYRRRSIQIGIAGREILQLEDCDKVTPKSMHKEKEGVLRWSTDAPSIPQRKSSWFQNYDFDDDECQRPRTSLKKKGMPRRSSIQTTGEEIKMYLPGQSQPIRRRTSITFAEKDEVKEVTPSRKLTNEPEMLWFQKDELRQIREKNRMLVNQVEAGQNKRKLCIRGLEDMMGESDCYKRQQHSVRSVLQLQELQRKIGYYDCDYMSRLYHHASKDSLMEATRRAMEDALAILHPLPSSRWGTRRSSM